MSLISGTSIIGQGHFEVPYMVSRLWGIHGKIISSYFTLSSSLHITPCYGEVIEVLRPKFETSFLVKFFLVSKSLIKFSRCTA